MAEDEKVKEEDRKHDEENCRILKEMVSEMG